MIPIRRCLALIILFSAVYAIPASVAGAADMMEMPVVKLRSLDKVTARTITFEANVGSTVKFGPLYIKAQACRKASPIEQPESAAFLQVWELDSKDEASWIFSGWMFASSPGLSSMDHSIYDVWVLDCLEKKTGQSEEEKQEEETHGDGEISEDLAPAEPVIEGGGDNTP